MEGSLLSRIGGSVLTVRSSSLSEVCDLSIEFRRRLRVTEIFIHRYNGVPICDVIVKSHHRQISIRCDDYDAALRWAQIECRSYGVIAGVIVEEGRYEPVAANSRAALSGPEPDTS